MLNDLINNGTVAHSEHDFHTFVTPRASSSPDIILNNHRCIHYTTCRPGSLTTSDHIPIIMHISSSPTLSTVPPRYQFSKADWDKFSNMLQEQPEINIDNKPTDYINSATEDWFHQITNAMSESIPKTSCSTTPHPPVTPDIQVIQNQYLKLLQQANTRNWSPLHRKILKALQINLQSKYILLRNQHWDKIIQNIEISHKDPHRFWRKIKNLMGNTTKPTAYLLDGNGEKIFNKQDQELLFREFYKKIFTISDEENAQYCQETERLVTEALQNEEQILPYPTIDISRLDPDCYLIAPITFNEVITSIQSFKKHKAPGFSHINC